MNTFITGTLLALILVCGRFQVLNGAPTIKEEKDKDSVRLKSELSNSLKLSIRLLHESKKLSHSYVAEKLQGEHLDFTGSHEGLPSLGVTMKEWLRMQAGDRLQILKEVLQVFPAYLEELEKWESDEGSVQSEDGSSHVTGRISSIRLDLRDLLHHIQLQMSIFGVSSSKPLVPKPAHLNVNNWRSKVQMYHALRSLEKTLHRAVREYTLLLRTVRA